MYVCMCVYVMYAYEYSNFVFLLCHSLSRRVRQKLYQNQAGLLVPFMTTQQGQPSESLAFGATHLDRTTIHDTRKDINDYASVLHPTIPPTAMNSHYISDGQSYGLTAGTVGASQYFGTFTRSPGSDTSDPYMKGGGIFTASTDASDLMRVPTYTAFS